MGCDERRDEPCKGRCDERTVLPALPGWGMRLDVLRPAVVAPMREEERVADFGAAPMRADDADLLEFERPLCLAAEERPALACWRLAREAEEADLRFEYDAIYLIHPGLSFVHQCKHIDSTSLALVHYKICVLMRDLSISGTSPF